MGMERRDIFYSRINCLANSHLECSIYYCNNKEMENSSNSCEANISDVEEKNYVVDPS